MMPASRAARRNTERWVRNLAAREAAPVENTETVYDDETERLVRRPTRQPKRDGLEWLRRKDHISEDERLAGVWFADCHRWAHMEGAVPIPSMLGHNVGAGGGAPPGEDGFAAYWIAKAKADYQAIVDRVGWKVARDNAGARARVRDEETLMVLLLVCVHGHRFSGLNLDYGETCGTIGEASQDARANRADSTRADQNPNRRGARMTRLTISTEMARLALMVDRCAAEASQSAGHPHILAEARMRPGTRDKLRGAFARLGYSLDAGVTPKGVEPFRPDVRPIRAPMANQHAA